MRKRARRFWSKSGTAVQNMEPEPSIQPEPDALESGTYRSADRAKILSEVTLVVYGWHNVQPGTLSWVFPSFQAALGAAGAMRNAVKWSIFSGRDASGELLAEA